MSRHEFRTFGTICVKKIVPNPQLSTSSIPFGADADGTDVIFYGDTTLKQVLWDESADTWYFGNSAYGVDVVFNSGTADDNMTWDSSDKELTFTDAHIEMGNADYIYQGFLADGSTNAITMGFDGSDFVITAGSTTEGVIIGGTTYNTDVTLNGAFVTGATAAGYGQDVTLWASDDATKVMLDTSENALLFAGVSIEFDSYLTGKAFDFANDGSNAFSATTFTGATSCVKVVLGATTGYLAIYTSAS